MRAFWVGRYDIALRIIQWRRILANYSIEARLDFRQTTPTHSIFRGKFCFKPSTSSAKAHVRRVGLVRLGRLGSGWVVEWKRRRVEKV